MSIVFIGMTPPTSPPSLADQDRAITATVLRERARLGNFILRRVSDKTEAEDILQDVFHEFIQAYRLPAPIEQASAWLFRVARNRIIDRFRKKREVALDDGDDPDEDAAIRLDLVLPASSAGPEAAYARAVMLDALHDALEALPANQREVFIAHELDGVSFKQMAAQSGVPINTLLARKRYAVLALRTQLQAAFDEFDL
jgi:RNA polymerase sigma factor (sigma-70 family)